MKCWVNVFFVAALDFDGNTNFVAPPLHQKNSKTQQRQD